MMRKWLSAALAAASILFGAASASAQFAVVTTCPNASVLYTAGQSNRVGLVDINGNHCISGSITATPSGTQDINIKQVQGAVPSLTNPLWVSPATGATFPVSLAASVAVTQSTSPWVVSGTVATTQSTSPWIVAGGGTAGVPGTAALTIQGIGSGTPVPVSGTVTANQGTPGSAWPVTLTSTTITGTVAVTESGTWTVQPGNTANTTPWLVTLSPSAASGAGVTPVSSSALAANTVIKASAGNLYSFEISADSTLSAAAWWIMIYNATSAPVDGAVTPLKCYAMPANTTAFSAAFPTPAVFSTGITIGVSTTGCFTKTASTHAFISGDAQ